MKKVDLKYFAFRHAQRPQDTDRKSPVMTCIMSVPLMENPATTTMSIKIEPIAYFSSF